MMDDVLAVLLTLALVGTNGFFVGAEFSLISARRDRLRALAEQGRNRAAAVLHAGERLPLMFAGAQFGITVASLLLGRIGQPAVADLIEPPLRLAGVPDPLISSIAFLVALGIVVVLHVLLGEMVPKNIAIAGPEKSAMLLIPPYLAYVRAVRPVIAFYNRCAKAVVRTLRVEPKDEVDVTVSTAELSEMIAESVSEGLLDRAEYTRLKHALQIRTRTVADLIVPTDAIRSVPAAGPGRGPTVGTIEQALRQTGFSRFPVTDPDGEFVGYLHIKDVLALCDTPEAVVDPATVRPLPRLSLTLALPTALSRLRGRNSHLALAVDTDGRVVGLVTLEDLVQNLVGAVRDSTQPG